MTNKYNDYEHSLLLPPLAVVVVVVVYMQILEWHYHKKMLQGNFTKVVSHMYSYRNDYEQALQ